MDHLNLVWRRTPSSRKARRAVAPSGIYFVQAVDDGFVLTFQGMFLAKASSMQGAQDYALIHVNKRESA
jgi:hypothetical protein